MKGHISNAIQRFRSIREELQQSAVLKPIIEIEMSEEEMKQYRRHSAKNSLLHLASTVALQHAKGATTKAQFARDAAIMIATLLEALLSVYQAYHQNAYQYAPSLTWKDTFRQLPKQSKMQQKGVHRPKEAKTLPKNRDNWKRVY